MSEPPSAVGGRLLGGAGTLGGLLWAALPVAAALAFYGVEARTLGLGGLAGLGALFQVAGLSVVGLLLGAAGLRRFLRGSPARGERAGPVVIAAGFALLLPGSVVPSGWYPPALEPAVPLVFFAGLATAAAGSLVLGVAARRTGALPPGLAVAFGASMPVGTAVGGAVAITGVGNLALVLGMMVPYGLVWVALGVVIARTGQAYPPSPPPESHA